MSFFGDIGKGFGSSWAGVIFNPAGYMMGRKSVSEAAAQYYEQNPPTIDVDVVTESSFAQERKQWVEACASKLKSDDVGKSKENSMRGCQAQFDGSGIVQEAEAAMRARLEEERLEMQDKAAKNITNAIMVIGAAAFILLLIYLFS